MERLKDLVSGTAVGRKLLHALEAHANSELPGLIAEVFNTLVQNESNKENGQLTRASLSDAASVVEGIMFTTPRGKQDLAFFVDYFVVKTAKSDIQVPYSKISHLAIVEMPKDPKKRLYLFLNIDEHGKQDVGALVIQTTADTQLNVPHPTTPHQRLSGPAPVVICQAFGMMGLGTAAFCSSDNSVFQSCGGVSGVEAYVKASQGTLFPMPAGLCFLERPALFIPRPSIKAVEFARAGGGSSTFDLYVHMRDGRTQEFSNISRSEVGALEEFVRRVQLPIGTGESCSEDDDDGEEGEEGSAAGAGDDSDDDSEDEDFNPSSSTEEEEEEGERDGAQGGQGASGRGGKRRGMGRESSREGAGLAGPGDAAGDPGSGSTTSSADDDDGDDDVSDDSSADGSVELVSEDEFSRGQLQCVIEAEDKPKLKRRRQA